MKFLSCELSPAYDFRTTLIVNVTQTARNVKLSMCPHLVDDTSTNQNPIGHKPEMSNSTKAIEHVSHEKISQGIE